MEEQKIQVKKALDERFMLGALIDLARKKLVPVHKHTIWYYMGALLLILFMIQMITGPILLFYYKPAAETAYQSVAEIMVKVPYGWLHPLGAPLVEQPDDFSRLCPFLFHVSGQGLPPAARIHLAYRHGDVSAGAVSGLHRLHPAL